MVAQLRPVAVQIMSVEEKEELRRLVGLCMSYSVTYRWVVVDGDGVADGNHCAFICFTLSVVSCALYTCSVHLCFHMN